MAHAHCMLDAKAFRHTGCVVLLFPLQHQLHERVSVLHYTILPVL
jgi:hypothetical protein